MKRITAIVCALSLLLAACSHPETASSTQAAKQTDAPQTTAAPTAEATAEPTATELPATDAPTEPTPEETGYHATGTPTGGGITVHTDPSAYVPYSAPKAKYTRLHDGSLDHFEPSDDYGAVYPYAAAREFEQGDDGYSWSSWNLYGIVDRNGRILTDGLYAKVYPMYYEDYEYGYGAEETDYQPFWITAYYEFAERHYEENGDYYWDETENHMGVISMDGSFALANDYVSVDALPEGFWCRRDRDSRDFEVYDGQGKLCFTGEQVIDPEAEGWDLDYGDGLYLVHNYYDEYQKSECWFVNAAGTKVLGPYQKALCFRDGLACVSVDGQGFGVIDKDGDMVIDQIAKYGDMYRYGHICLDLLEGGRAVFDREGKQLVKYEDVDDTYLTLTEYGIRVERNGRTKFFDYAGKLLAEGNDYLQMLDENTFAERRSDGVYKMFRQDGTELLMPEDAYLQDIVKTVLDGEVVSAYLLSGYDSNINSYVYSFAPEDLSAVIPLDTTGLAEDYLYYAFQTLKDPITNETWYLTWDRDGWNAVSETGAVRQIPVRSTGIMLYGDLVRVITDRSCTFLDADNNVVFAWPIEAGD